MAAAAAIRRLRCRAADDSSNDQAFAQAWPNRTVTAIVPFAAGNANDIVARIVLDQVSKQVGQAIVPRTVPAPAASPASRRRRATPDGYTMLVHSSSFSASYSLHKQLPYDTFKDFIAVVPLGFQPTVLVVAASKPWKTLGELLAEAKAEPGSLDFASAGAGAASASRRRSASASPRDFRRCTFPSKARSRRSPK